VRFCIAPTKRTKDKLPEAETRRFRMRHPRGKEGPNFQARILMRTGATRDKELRSWFGRASGIRVFMEGFRVLPYGEQRNDWLGLDRDSAERSSDFLDEETEAALTPSIPAAPNDRPGLLILPNKHYFGGVFLTQRNAPSLKLLVNREGFVPDASYDYLVSLMRTGIDLSTRIRASVTALERQQRSARRRKRETRQEGAQSPLFLEVLGEAVGHASAARRFIAAGDSSRATREVDRVLEQIRESSEELTDERAMLRVLASVGTQLSSFVHELNGLLGMTEAIETALRRRIDEAPELRRDTRVRLREVAKSIADLRRHLERHASYLIDVVSADARRRVIREYVLNAS